MLIWLGMTRPLSMHYEWQKLFIFLKIYIFWKQFKLEKCIECIATICIFVIKLHVKAWFTQHLIFSDYLQYLNCFTYQLVDTDISNIGIKKCSHSWNLSIKSATLLFFDKNVHVLTKKQKMIATININLEEIIKLYIIINKPNFFIFKQKPWRFDLFGGFYVSIYSF